MKHDFHPHFPGQEVTAGNSQACFDVDKIETRQILDTAPVGIAVTDARRHFVSANPAMCALAGHAAAKSIGQLSRLFCPTGEEFTRVGAEKPGQFQLSGQCILEARMVHKNGRPLDAAANAVKFTERGSVMLAMPGISC